jgi:hypothetical protein
MRFVFGNEPISRKKGIACDRNSRRQKRDSTFGTYVIMTTSLTVVGELFGVVSCFFRA